MASFENAYVYFTSLPDGINEMVVPCTDGYTIYIDESLNDDERLRAYKHALKHIDNRDFEGGDEKSVQKIESEAHELT